MLSGKFPQISASDYIGKMKKPDALSPSHRAFPLWPLPFGKANFVGRSSSKTLDACTVFSAMVMPLLCLDAKKIKMPVFPGIFFGLLDIIGEFYDD